MNMNAAENIEFETETNDTMNAIDAAIAKAKARAAGRIPDDSGMKRSPEEREASRAAARAERERIRAEKAATKRSTPVHMRKVERAAAALPGLIDGADSIVDDIVSRFSPDQITAIALHLQHRNRVAATIAAVSGPPLRVGQVVRITGGDPRFIGMSGAVEKVQRIRCYVKVPGVTKLVYSFTSDVSPLNEEAEEVPESSRQSEEATG